MSFRLKNARETYQKMVTTLLYGIIVKSRDREGHIVNLRNFFERIKEYKLKFNPQKFTFRVTAWKLLGFLVSDRGIEVDPSKIKVILDMPRPKSEKEIRGFLGRL